MEERPIMLEATLEEKEQHAELVSEIEDAGLEGWSAALSANNPGLAGDIKRAWTRAEHFSADLSAIAQRVTSEEAAERERRIAVLNNLLGRLNETGYGGKPIGPVRLR